MDAIESIQKRYGCRKYLDKPVEREKLGLVLDAGRLAPSAGNLQDRSFLVVRDEGSRGKIADACGNQSWMKTAPVHIVVISENKKLGKFFGQKGDKIYSVQDTSFAAENMLLAATALELGCSLVVGFSDEALNDLFAVKAPAQILAIITLGYSAEQGKQSAKYPLEKFVYFEKYGQTIEELAAAFGEWGAAREKFTSEKVKDVKRESKNLFSWLKSKFKKKEEPMHDHFMEKKEEIKEPVRESKEEIEIPRQLPR
ncbi:nitroreductase family protein [Candidatus Woesearchaeota archaeon]|nr:nitroreductase family protein [Candidatus Woesearchaeota archaeon]